VRGKRNVNIKKKVMLYWFRFLQIMSGSMSFDNLSSLSLMRTSESFSDLNAELSGAASSSRAPARSSLASLRSTTATAAQTTTTSLTNPTAIGSASAAEECNNNINNKPFGLGETIKDIFITVKILRFGKDSFRIKI
jgi:hypothetical protein